MRKILGTILFAAALISSAGFANAAGNDARHHTCTFQGYACSDWQQQNGS